MSLDLPTSATTVAGCTKFKKMTLGCVEFPLRSSLMCYVT